MNSPLNYSKSGASLSEKHQLYHTVAPRKWQTQMVNRARQVSIHDFIKRKTSVIDKNIGQTAQQPSPSSEQKTCANCSKPETSPDPETPTLKPCITCKSVLYCSRDCKKAHQKQHKKVCASLAQEYSKTADIKMASRAPPKESHRGGLQKWQFDT